MSDQLRRQPAVSMRGGLASRSVRLASQSKLGCSHVDMHLHCVAKGGVAPYGTFGCSEQAGLLCPGHTVSTLDMPKQCLIESGVAQLAAALRSEQAGAPVAGACAHVRAALGHCAGRGQLAPHADFCAGERAGGKALGAASPGKPLSIWLRLVCCSLDRLAGPRRDA